MLCGGDAEGRARDVAHYDLGKHNAFNRDGKDITAVVRAGITTFSPFSVNKFLNHIAGRLEDSSLLEFSLLRIVFDTSFSAEADYLILNRCIVIRAKRLGSIIESVKCTCAFSDDLPSA